MRISDWSSDVCSSDLLVGGPRLHEVTLEHDGDAVGNVRHDTHVVGDQQDAGVQLVLVRAQQVEDIGQHGARKSVVLGKSGSVRVDLGGRSIIQQKETETDK